MTKTMKIIRGPERTDLLKQLTVLLARLTKKDHNYKQLYASYSRELSGHTGETSLEYYLRLADIQDALLSYGLRLKEPGGYFQIDLLILTPAVCFIIEVKNLTGTVCFNQADQLIRTKNGQHESFQHPLTQAKIQAKHLKHLLEREGYNALPIHPVVVFTHPDVILENTDNNPDILCSQQLVARLNDLQKSFRQPLYKQNRLRTLARRLNSKHEPKRENVIKKHQLLHHDIRPGVWCPHCKKTIMHRIYGCWFCHSCKEKDRSAHLEALRDYAIIHKKTISNKEARAFLLLKSADVTKRLLTRGKNRIYHLDTLLSKSPE